MQVRLTLYEREKIEFYLRHKQKIRHIAHILGRDHSVVSREIKRNKSPWFPYSAQIAQAAADRRSTHTNKTKIKKYPLLKEYIIARLQEGWSPEQISGRLQAHPPPELRRMNLSISYEQIYQWIYSGARDEDGVYIYHYLPRRKPKRVSYHIRKAKKLPVSDRVSIHVRPKEINTKTDYGHWESDTVVYKGRRSISVQFERKSKLLRIHRLINHGAEATREAIIQSIDSLPIYLWRSITFDNGGENARHTELKQDFGLTTYFCDPFSAWQKGGVENSNGLIRRLLPKGTNLNEVTNEQLHTIQEALNNRPRKSLQYRTPNEIVKEIGALNS